MQAGWRPEILAPAGDLQRLKTAVLFGADAVYVGGTKFGLRKNADNFNVAELQAGIAFAHQHGAKVYVTCNIHPLQRDWAEFAAYAAMLQELRPDALIIADPGVAAHIRDHTNLRIHVSTQASVLNCATAERWRARGAARIVTAREVSLAAAGEIRQATGVEIECFAHGAMCASFSGKCVISNYTAGRDANRGGCVQTCRNSFTVHQGRDAASPVDFTANTMNARDLMGIEQMPLFYRHHIDACKIEGRMKSAHYVALTVATYRYAAEACAEKGNDKSMRTGKNSPATNPVQALLGRLSNRGYSHGGLIERPFIDSLNLDFDTSPTDLVTVGQVLHSDPECGALVALKMPLAKGQTLRALTPAGHSVSFPITELRDTRGRAQDAIHAQRSAWIVPPTDGHLPAYSVVWHDQRPQGSWTDASHNADLDNDHARLAEANSR
jgi:putative protease